MTYIAIEGVIGVGKTTLARMLQPEVGGHLLLEVFEENPFLSSFYGDRARYAFQTQIFFLLSRYRQQRALRMMTRPVLSDYIFAKDALFARVNLSGDELAMYERVHEALAEQVDTPDLLVYLRADTDTLMRRIQLRDRPYERNMERDYLDSLRQAYDDFFASYSGRVLVLDANEFDFVARESDRTAIFGEVLAALGRAPRQESLPGFNGELRKQGTPLSAPAQPVPEPEAPALPPAPDLTSGPRRLGDYQQFHDWLDAAKGFSTDPLLNFVKMQEEIGELARLVAATGGAMNSRLAAPALEDVGSEMADVLAYLLKLANYMGVDLEAAYMEKMQRNQGRDWH